MTTPIQTPLTALVALDLTKQVVAERGDDYVYVNPEGLRAGTLGPPSGPGKPLMTADCSYVHRLANGEVAPGCLAGNVLARAGVSLEVLSTYEGCSVPVFAEDAGFADEEAADVLGVMQAMQDRGASWGLALAEGVMRYEQVMESKAKMANQEVGA